MDFKVGDKISVLDQDIEGTVSRVEHNKVFVDTIDGFLMEFAPSELLKISRGDGMRSNIFSGYSYSRVLAEKEPPPRKPSSRIKPKERNKPTMEVDLHIHQLTNDERHLSNYDMLNLQLDTAKRQLEFAMAKRIQKVVFIHGVGEGVLKSELEYLFNRYDNVKFYAADFQKYGLGATEVYIFQNP